MAVETKTLIEARTLIDVAARNLGIIEAQVSGLTHEDSLLQLPFRGNCLNWILGHITQQRDIMLQVVDEPVVMTPEEDARYARNSPPITSGGDAMRLEDMLADLRIAQERLVHKLLSMSPDDLLVPAKDVIKGIPPWTVAEFLNFLLWHETYHVGQTEPLRQLAGKNDKVI